MLTLMARPGRLFVHPSLDALGRCAFRQWLAVGMAGLLFVLALPLWDELWTVNRASIFLDRYIATDNAAALTKAIEILEAAPPIAEAGTGKTVPRGDNPSFWRTYGAAAAHRPTEEAFRRLVDARTRGRLDRTGELWLGEVASATGHWQEAEEAYSRIDASNLLIARGETARQEGRAKLARHWYLAAAASVYAAADREAARAVQFTRGRAFAGPLAGPLDPEASRAVPLLRIGRGFLALGYPGDAVPVLERAAFEMQADPPGTRERQSVYFSLAQALIRATPRGRPIPPEVSERVRSLIEQALEIDHTGAAHLQAGQTWELLGERSRAVSDLKTALRLDPRLPEAYLSLGAIFENDGLVSLARDLYGAGVEHLPADPALLTAWALASYRTRSPAEALPALLAAAASESREPYLFAALGDCYLDLGQPDRARAAYKEGLRRAPGARPLMERLTKLLRPAGQVP